MKLPTTKTSISVFSIYFLTVLISCEKTPEPINTDKPVSQIVAGNYSGDGKYMPSITSLGAATLTCITPNWEALLKSGSATANLTSLDDSTVSITLGGAIYANAFSRNYILTKKGNIISDDNEIVKFFIDTKSLQLAFSNIIIATGSTCVPVNKYYYVFEGPITNPPFPRYSYTSIGTWEFNGTK